MSEQDWIALLSAIGGIGLLVKMLRSFERYLSARAALEEEKVRELRRLRRNACKRRHGDEDDDDDDGSNGDSDDGEPTGRHSAPPKAEGRPLARSALRGVCSEEQHEKPTTERERRQGIAAAAAAAAL